MAVPTSAAVSTQASSSSSSSSSWWPLSTKGWLIVGGVVVSGFVLYLLRRRTRAASAWQSPPGEYDDILKSLRSSESQQTVALKQLYEYSRYPKKHDSIRQTGVLEILLQILAQHPDNDVLLLHLTRVVANLAINEENRLVLGRASTVSDLFYLLEHTEDKIKEHILRCLLNLSLEDVIEDVIRETGGLKQLTDMFASPHTSPSVLFQTTRVLINLVHNANNRALTTQEGLVQQAVQRLTTSATVENIDFCLRLLNLVGLFAVDCAPEVLAQIATKETAEAFNNLLSLSQSVDHVSTVLQATLKILARKHTQPQEVQPFIDALIEKTGPQPSGLEHVVAFYKNSDGPVLELARHVLADLAENNEKATAAINEIDPALLSLGSSPSTTDSADERAS